MDRVSQALTKRVKELAERYEMPMPQLTSRVVELEAKVNGHLERMGLPGGVPIGHAEIVVVTPEPPQVAGELALATGRTVYDAVYVARAMRESCRFVTADERLVDGLAGTPHRAHLVWLGAL
jgi:hypothetical protein